MPCSATKRCLQAQLVVEYRVQLACSGRTLIAMWLHLRSVQAVDKVLAEVPTNVQVLNLLEMLLKRLGRTIDATEAVLAASAAQPKNLELLHAVFDLHIRCSIFPYTFCVYHSVLKIEDKVLANINLQPREAYLSVMHSSLVTAVIAAALMAPFCT